MDRTDPATPADMRVARTAASISPPLVLAVCTLLLLTGTSAAKTIAVGGWRSEVDPLNATGVFETARWIAYAESMMAGADPMPAPYILPDGVPQEADYRSVELNVNRDARAALARGERVTLLGYSHGATLVLRVAHDLARDGLPLANVTVVTIDRIAFQYPILPAPDSVPSGVSRALNILQTIPLPAASLRGGRVSGASELSATDAIQFERTRGRQLGGGNVPSRFQLDDYHVFIAQSVAVRRAVLAWFGFRSYLAGIYRVRVAGVVRDFQGAQTRSINQEPEFVLDEWLSLDPGRFVAVWRDGPQLNYFVGSRLAANLTTVAFWFGSQPLCIASGAHGYSSGEAGSTFDTFTMTLVGGELAGGVCTWSGGARFDGLAVGSSLLPPLTAIPGENTDSDADGLPDAWEREFGLNSESASAEHGALGDPDGDGRTNAQELAAGTHPRGFVARYLAEGAVNAFFDVRLALLNVGTEPAHVQLRFLQSGGATTSRVDALAPGRRYTLTRADLTDLSSPDFSTVLESDQPMVLDRTMSWDGAGYGSHAETGVASPATNWILAEGSTSGDFALFYLLQNPNSTATTATVRYLRPFGQPPVDRQYALPPNSRTTIPVDDQGPDLANTDVSAVVTAPVPLIVERAMYRSNAGQAFAAGHGSAGVVAPVTSWFLAEGTTGPFFDLFILLANPNSQDAAVRIDYLLSDGRTFTKAYAVPANGRFTVWVDDEQIPASSGVRPLDNVAVSSTITSTNGVPIVVERTMWWPSPALTATFWTEAHNSPGATATATRWALAEGEVGGSHGAETYILIANTSMISGTARVTLYFEDGTTAVRTVALLPRSRTNVSVSTEFAQASGKRFGSVIESLGTTPAQIVVERAMYTSPGGVTWAAGTNALATPLP